MGKLYLVRHGEATTSWGVELDPGLNDLGRAQAKAAAEILAPLGPLDIVSSPLARARETSLTLAQTWGVPPLVEERVGEIPSPTGDQSERVEWLRVVMGDRWSNQGRDLDVWRRGVIKALSEFERDTVVFTHFIAINAALGAATGDDRVVCFRPDNGSITTFEKRDVILTLVERGEEAITEVC